MTRVPRFEHGNGKTSPGGLSKPEPARVGYDLSRCAPTTSMFPGANAVQSALSTCWKVRPISGTVRTEVRRP